jgi:hypothetical protein
MPWILTDHKYVNSDRVITIEKHDDESVTLRLTDGSDAKVSNKQEAKAAVDVLAPSGLPSRN